MQDARNLKGRYEAIVTDLPYGKNTTSQDLEELYSRFLTTAFNVTNKIVVMCPDFVDIKKLCFRWKIIGEFNYYLHKSLSKKILVLLN